VCSALLKAEHKHEGNTLGMAQFVFKKKLEKKNGISLLNIHFRWGFQLF
jgi:hypothetical protein